MLPLILFALWLISLDDKVVRPGWFSLLLFVALIASCTSVKVAA